MDKAEITLFDEFERLNELLSYNILDTEPDINFDEIATLAAHICSVPIGLVTLIDESRQWFKAAHGLKIKETSRNISFCAHAIQQAGVFEISDARLDPRFSRNPTVVGDLKVVFYAGYPLRTHKGYNLGTLCVVAHEPKKLTKAEKEGLRVLAKQVVARMELIKKNSELKNLNDEIKSLSRKIKNQSVQVATVAKMASLGVMAKGVSHEINNPLSIICMITEKVRTVLPDGSSEKLMDEMNKIDDLVMRIGTITKGLELFSRDSSNDSSKLEKAETLVENTLLIIGKKIEDEGVNLILEGFAGQEIFCRGGEVSQVLLSLLANSLDAVENDPSERWIKVSVSENEKATVLSVSDSGRGINAAYIGKIMDPFFTTKSFVGGVGLGLSTSQAIMKLHNGKLVLDRKQENTKFDMVFPKV